MAEKFRVVFACTWCFPFRLLRKGKPTSGWPYFRALRRLFNWAVEEGFLEVSPLAKTHFKSPSASPVEPFTQDELKRLLAVCELDIRTGARFTGLRNRAIIFVFLDCGLRRAETASLKLQDLHLDARRVTVIGKGNKVGVVPFCSKTAKGKRTIALGPSVLIMLSDHHTKQVELRAQLGIPLSEQDLVFAKYDGKPLRPNTITRAWAIIAQSAGVKVIRLHDARHTHASLMLKQGIHPKIVQERLGHSTISTTLDTYSHVTPGLQQAAAKSFDEQFSHKYNETVIDEVEK